MKFNHILVDVDDDFGDEVIATSTVKNHELYFLFENLETEGIL